MTKNISHEASDRREQSRKTDGTFGHQHHSEAQVNLATQTSYSPDDHVQLSPDDHVQLAESLQEALNEFSGSWEADHNEDAQVSYVREIGGPDRRLEQELMGYEETDMVFSIGAEDHLAKGKITIDCEAASDGHNLAGPRATELEEDGWLVPEQRSSHEADSLEDAIDWAKDKVRARKVNDAYNARHDDRAEALDQLARSESIHVVSAVQHDISTADKPGLLSDSYHRYSYQDVPQEVFDDTAAIYSNTQQHHFGVGASNADELRSAYFVSSFEDDGELKWLVSHAYGVHSETEAQDGYRNVAVCHDREHAQFMAHQGSQQELDSGSIASVNRDTDSLFEDHQQGYVMALDVNHMDGMIALRKPQDFDHSRHRLD